MDITAYRVDGATELPIVPAPPRRQWHNDIPGIGACLPLTIANGAGWWLLNPQGFTVDRLPVYNNQVHIEYGGYHQDKPDWVLSHFGFGVMTVVVPYVFRTPPGWELLIRGPSNVFYDGLHAFEGIVESDWHAGTATMNWMVEEGTDLVIPEGAPLAQIVPTQVSTLEEFQVKSVEMPDDLEEEFARFAQSRADRIATNKADGKVRYEGVYPRNERTKRRVLKLAGIV